MRKLLPDILLLLLLAVAIGEGVWLAVHRPAQRLLLPMQQAGDPPGLLMGPGQAEQVFQARIWAVGDWVTIEDLVRGALLLEEGRLEGAEPLTDRERRRLASALEDARVHRDELLRIEGEIRQAQASMADHTREAVGALSPEQRAWILARRDEVSVGTIERAYWDALRRTLEEDGP